LLLFLQVTKTEKNDAGRRFSVHWQTVIEPPAAEPTTLASRPVAGPVAGPTRTLLPPWLALAQVIAVSGFPTQLFVAVVLIFVVRMPITDLSSVPLEFIATVSFLDTALIALLIRVFLGLSGETSRDVFIGWRPVGGEIWRGLVLVPAAFLSVVALVLFLRLVGPWPHVTTSPLKQYMGTPIDAIIFTVVVVLAGGVREELQRAFILHRFEQRLGGIYTGLALYSVMFCLLHVDQGIDAMIAVGGLGVMWGLFYIKRGSIVMAMTNHAGFNAAQVAGVFVQRMFGA
jgi:membrane protease YdiL (CAAX protease family)